MKRIFGKKEVVPPPTLEEATEKLDGRGNTIDDKIRRLDAQLVQHRDVIRRTRPGPAQEAAKRRALTVMKQKRLYESQRTQLYNQQFNVEQAAFAVQSMQDSTHTVRAMVAAEKELRTVLNSKDLKITNIERMQDRMQDLLDTQNDIQDALGSSFAVPDEIDEDEMLDELDALEGELADEQGESAGGVPSYLDEFAAPEPAHATAIGGGGGGMGGGGGGGGAGGNVPVPAGISELDLPAVPMAQRN